MSVFEVHCSSGLSVCTHEAHIILETLHAKHTRSNSNLDCITALTKSGTHESATEYAYLLKLYSCFIIKVGSI